MSVTGSSEKNKSVILLHGAIGAADQLQLLAVELTSLGYDVHSFSFSGHGKMPFNNEISIPQFANELKDYIQKNNLFQPYVFGYSMGGYVALYLASINPKLLGKITTLGTKFLWDKEIAEREVKQLDPDTIMAKVPKFAEVLEKRHGSDWKQLLKQTADMMVAMGNNNPLSDELLLSIENEVLIGIADKDTMVSLDETLHVFRQLKNSNMYMLPNTKHPIETADTKALASILHNFMK